MLITHDEATEKVCHLSMGAEGTDLYYCLGRGCMAWRDQEDTRDVAGTDEPPPGDGWRVAHVTGESGLVTRRTKWVRDAGYCGWIPPGGRRY
jgi:hypothetical protein